MLKKFFIYSAVIPVLIGIALYYINTNELLEHNTLVHGAPEDINIYKIEYGVKIVDAETYLGAIYGLGYITSRDRLWQLVFLRMLS
jgi:acyl-homoserine lactone acylase PvdQ